MNFRNLAKRSGYPTALLLFLSACIAPAAMPQTATPAQSEVAEAAYPMTIADDYGDVTIPARPERIITIGEEINETLVSLGVHPVGFGSSRVERGGAKELGIPIGSDYLDAGIAGSPIFVGGDSPSLEAVVALQPDLIIYPNYDEATYKALAQIAPTLGLAPQGRGAWQRILGKLGQVLGLEEKAAEVIADYDARVAELREQLAPVLVEHPNVTLLYLPGADNTMVFDERFAFGGMVDDLGFNLVIPDGVTIDDSGFAQISVESLAGLESDAILTIQFAEGALVDFPVEPIMASLDIPVLRTVIEARRPASGPYTERYYLENFATLLQDEFGAAAE